MSKVIKKVASVAAPVLGTIFAPGIGTALGSSLSGAALSGIGGALGGGLGGAVSGGGLSGALSGAGMGGLGGYLGGGGLSNLLSGGAAQTGLLTQGAMPMGGTMNLAAGAPGAGGLLSYGALPAGATSALSGGIAGASPLMFQAGGAVPSGAFAAAPSYGLGNRLSDMLQGSTIQQGGMGNTLGQIYSGVQGTQAYKEMERAQRAANQQALSAVSPFQQSGVAAQSRLSGLLGLGGENQEDILEQLRSTPGYQFRQEQGQRGLDRSLAARGGLLSGRALQESQRLGQGLADQTYNDYVRTLQQQSGQGLGAATAMSPLYTAGGDIQAGSIYGQQDVLNKSLSNILNPVRY